MKQKLWCYLFIGLMLCVPACSKNQIKSVLDDISRDTYEKNLRAQRLENIDNPIYEEPPSYDQYQRERKEMFSDDESTPSAAEMEK